jgi:signal transduction histidine kinase
MPSIEGLPLSLDAKVARLRAHRALGHAPQAELEWLAARSVLVTYEAGDVLLVAGVASSTLNVVLAGRFVILVDKGSGPQLLFEFKTGDVAGMLPFSRGARAPANVTVTEPSQNLEMPASHFPEMIRECPTITAACVHAMLDRARHFSTSDIRDEKLVSLGRLAAGLAHELGNPASAAVRSARSLDDALKEIERASASVGAAGLTPAQRAVIERVRGRCFARLSGPALSPMARADREEELGAWLRAHGVREDCAEPLAETSLKIAALDELAEAITGEALDASIRWIAAGCLVRTLSAEIQMATSRIHQLVASVKGFTFMDHARIAEPVDIRAGLDDTFTMLASKTRANRVEVVQKIPGDLPMVQTVGAELNQVWMNLIDNALDALKNGGRLTVLAAVEEGRVAVRIQDDGPGIPPELLGMIFDPFFTTKDVGHGTGLGLDIVRRILHRIGGEVAVESEPGRTEFRVMLPIAR